MFYEENTTKLLPKARRDAQIGTGTVILSKLITITLKSLHEIKLN